MTTKDELRSAVTAMHTPSSQDWESIPSGLGARLLNYLLSQSDLYGKNNLKIEEKDIVTLSASGLFGGAIAFAIGGEAGRCEWQKNWISDKDAVVAAMALIARCPHNKNKFTSSDISASVLRDPEIAKAMLNGTVFEMHSGRSPFRILKEEDISIMYSADIVSVAAVMVADRRMIPCVLRSIPEGNCKDFLGEVVRSWMNNESNPIDVLSGMAYHVDPCGERGQSLIDHLVPHIGTRWRTKADRSLRTHDCLIRDASPWSEDSASVHGWLRQGLNHCTEQTPDRLVGWIGEAPCLYEFLNTAAKQRRGIIAARRLIKMMGR